METVISGYLSAAGAVIEYHRISWDGPPHALPRSASVRDAAVTPATRGGGPVHQAPVAAARNDSSKVVALQVHMSDDDVCPARL